MFSNSMQNPEIVSMKKNNLSHLDRLEEMMGLKSLNLINFNETIEAEEN